MDALDEAPAGDGDEAVLDVTVRSGRHPGALKPTARLLFAVAELRRRGVSWTLSLEGREVKRVER